jgi:hypothetical protein
MSYFVGNSLCQIKSEFVKFNLELCLESWWKHPVCRFKVAKNSHFCPIFWICQTIYNKYIIHVHHKRFCYVLYNANIIPIYRSLKRTLIIFISNFDWNLTKIHLETARTRNNNDIQSVMHRSIEESQVCLARGYVWQLVMNFKQDILFLSQPCSHDLIVNCMYCWPFEFKSVLVLNKAVKFWQFQLNLFLKIAPCLYLLVIWSCLKMGDSNGRGLNPYEIYPKFKIQNCQGLFLMTLALRHLFLMETLF